MNEEYDFIVVGAGASGCVVASRLAESPSKPSVLLIEAGGDNSDVPYLDGAERSTLAFKENTPLNWGYKTAPQHHLAGQSIDYSRGKGLGGSTAINFCGWVVGSRDDYNHWATLVGDDAFGWRNVKRCLNKIEHLHVATPASNGGKYVDVDVENKEHSGAGKLHLTYGDSWLPDVGDIFLAAEQSGLRINKDVNCGDPIGMGIGSECIHGGKRLTASSAYLSKRPQNLTVRTDSPVAKVTFKEKVAIGVRTADGSKYLARKEVVLSSGALNTPQIMMLSGIGPADELRKHGIPLLTDNKHVGRNLQDHCFSAIGVVLRIDPSISPDQTQSPTPMAWVQLDGVLSSPEFKDLPQHTKDHLRMATVPTYEMATFTPARHTGYDVKPSERFIGAISLDFNPQSKGEISLQSSDPMKPPVFDPRFLTHPFDRRVMIEGMRQSMAILSAPVYAEKAIKWIGPENQSDEAIWDYVKPRTNSSWHMSCTARMGKTAEEACVDSSFKVFGVDKLRVIDLSVCPFVPNNHTQSTAYVVGEIGAERVIADYALDLSLSARL